MNVKLCRTCGRSGPNFTNIFKTEGLKNKIETCLPIVVSQHCLLPDTLCPDCLISIENFYVFTKSCLQNIIILEAQLDVQESSLKAKRRQDKSCVASLPLANKSKCVQTEDYLNILLGERKDFGAEFPLTHNFFNEEKRKSKILVDYEVSDSNSSDENDSQSGQVILSDNLQNLKVINDIIETLMTPKIVSVENQGLISEITERKNSQKRKSDGTENNSSKTYKTETGNKRKCTKPKKLDKSVLNNNHMNEVTAIKKEIDSDDFGEENYGQVERTSTDEDQRNILPQCCLLCNTQLADPTALAEHFMKVHTREASQPNADSLEFYNSDKKRRSIPSLLKISDLRRSESFGEDSPLSDHHTEEQAATLKNITCPNCPTVFSTKTELFVHLQLNHSEMSTYLCGICLNQANSAFNLRTHVLNCVKTHPISTRYFCQVCCFGEDNYRTMESHVLVHNFLWKSCQKEMKNFDPEDYIQKNSNVVMNCASPIKNFSCLECNRSDFDTFKKFSIHRRNVHSTFHCDLCNKFYGRNSHLWKHVNRLHKNHPSITCQICFKTSASKYHLAQHFAKIHQAKTIVKKEHYDDSGDTQDRADGFDIGTAQKQDSTDQENVNTSCDENSINQSSQSDNDTSMDHDVAPKEIDPTHDLYANILTNYTPPKNEGDYKCPKCSKGFHKRMLLRKHKKNCRPKLQKDLLTRCKTCARIFKDRQSLAKHLINYHSDYECEICNEKVPSKCEIVSHIRFQHPSSHLICSVCDNILRCRKDLLEHLADHENSFVCQFCGDALASKVKLKMHILSLHRKILSLSCGICLKLFETQQVLRNHVALIHKEKLVPFISCPVCGKNYGSKWKTFDHVNKSHGRFFKACKICLEIYETESELETHMRTLHQNQHVPSNNASKPNPVAILSTAIKAENAPLHLNHNENNFDSDSEGNTEETENSQTSESEDDENSRPNVPEEQKQPAPSFSSQENKISLLEKRLLGKALGHTDTALEKHIAGNMYKSCLVNNANKVAVPGEFTKDKSTSPKIKRDEDGKKLDSHHSKRTVYENSNDPSFCEICHKTWPAKKHLWQHYIRCHKRVAATVCGICLRTNSSYEALQIHLRETHPNLLHGQGYGSNFICRICGRYHNASSKLRLHMVIHEKFDWSLLEKFPPSLKCNGKNIVKDNVIRHGGPGYIVNGEENREIKKDIDILNANEEMYDALIEQVEESTSSTDVGTAQKTQDSSSNSYVSNPAYIQKNEGQDIENRLSFSNLLQTLKNHNQFQVLNRIHQNAPSGPIVQPNNTPAVRAESVIRMRQGNNTVSSIRSSDKPSAEKPHSYLSEETSSSITDCERNGDGNSQSEVARNEENKAYDAQYYNRNIFRPKPEELDSAIKSISDPCNEPQIKAEYSDFNESVQGNCLNETEIESAVGSIL